MGLRILFLTPRYPYPLIGGDRVKAYHLLRGLAVTHDVTCASMVEGGDASAAQREAIARLGVRVETTPLSPLKAIVRVAVTLLSRKPLEIQYYTDRRFAALVARLMREFRPDAIVSFFMRTAEYALPYAVPRVLVAEDARLLLQERATAGGGFSAGSFMRAVERRKLARYEPGIIGKFDCVTYVAEADRAKMQALNPAARTAIVTNGVDLDAFPFNGDQEQRRGIVFAGKMDVLHNRIMAEALVRDVMPRVLREVPGAVCTIVGKNPPASIKRLASANVIVTGEVPHTAPYLSSAAVFAHPLRVGAGIQNKVLEAMAAGVAVVTTPEGISGIAAQDGVHAFIARDMETFAARCVELLRDARLRARLASEAHALVAREHSWQHVTVQLQRVLDRIVTRPAAPIAATEEVVA